MEENTGTRRALRWALALGVGCALAALSWGQCGDAYDPDDACPAARLIQGGETQNHDFCGDGADWIKFTACKGRSYTLETVLYGASVDTALEIYSLDCAGAIAFDDNGGGGLASRIENWSPASSGVYRALVSQADGSAGPEREYAVTLTGDTSPCGTWEHNYGGADHDRLACVRQTGDGGYAAVGYSESFTWGYDYWLLKLDENGDIVWQKAFDTPGWIEVGTLRETSDGGFAVCGSIYISEMSSDAMWILKVDGTGAVQWEKFYYPSDSDYSRIFSMEEMGDRGFIAAGRAYFATGEYDTVVLRTDDSGNVLWQKRAGGNGMDWLNSIKPTPDGGAVAAGITYSYGAGNSDIWVVKFDASGNIEWQNAYGESLPDDAKVILPDA
jgi:hypothetical protein